jgi:hypothetical protein
MARECYLQRLTRISVSFGVQDVWMVFPKPHAKHVNVGSSALIFRAVHPESADLPIAVFFFHGESAYQSGFRESLSAAHLLSDSAILAAARWLANALTCTPDF